MTEAEWNSCTDPQAMLTFLRDSGKLSDRKARLFAVACCGRVCHLVPGELWRKAVHLAQRFPEGGVSSEEQNALFPEVCNAYEEYGVDSLYEGYLGFDSQNPTVGEEANAALATLCTILRFDVNAGNDDVGAARPYDAISMAAKAAARAAAYPIARTATRPAKAWEKARQREALAQTALLRCIFGSPFRSPPPLPVSVLQGSQGIVRRLAEEAYEKRQLPSGHLDPERIAILADALEEAGCADQDILGHLREPGPHCRGCWPVDLLLAKE
jgi:hypothetical protein